MIVVADTSPINYLLLIDEIDLLPALFTSILIPRKVHQELLDDLAPPLVSRWAAHLPEWCEVRQLSPAPAIEAFLKRNP